MCENRQAVFKLDRESKKSSQKVSTTWKKHDKKVCNYYLADSSASRYVGRCRVAVARSAAMVAVRLIRFLFAKQNKITQV